MSNRPSYEQSNENLIILFSEKLVVPFKRYSEDAIVLLRAYPCSAENDLYGAEFKILKARWRVLVRVDLHMTIPKGFYGRTVGRSGLANNRGIFVFPGTIDTDYRDVVCIVLFNLSDNDYEVRKGNRIAQIIIERCYDVKFVWW